MISCLCITQDRPEFYEFLLWNFDKQTTDKKRELVIVDASVTPYKWPERENVRVIRVDPSLNIPQMRNIALETAAGDVITWWDDDDWKHPDMLKVIDNSDYDLVGSSKTYFVRLDNGLAAPFTLSYPWPGSLGVKNDDLPTFNEKTERGSDHAWIKELTKRNMLFIDDPLHFLVTHTKNISNPSTRWEKEAVIPISEVFEEHGLDKIWQQ